MTPVRSRSGPQVTYNEFSIYPAAVNGVFWVGYAPTSSERQCGSFIAADLDGQGGCPQTNIAPGLGYPTGWQDVGVVWGPTQALAINPLVSGDPPPNACCLEGGICFMTSWLCGGQRLPNAQCELNPCALPVRTISWGWIKAIYR